MAQQEGFWDGGGDDDGEPGHEGEGEDGWGAMAEDWDEAHETVEPAEGDTVKMESNKRTHTPEPSTSLVAAQSTFQDSGEPDFAGWLKAQKDTKSPGKPALKGIQASRSSNLAPPGPTVTSSPKKVGTASMKKSMRKQQSAEEEEEGWGDAWE